MTSTALINRRLHQVTCFYRWETCSRPVERILW
jgi:hypothetical protein